MILISTKTKSKIKKNHNPYSYTHRLMEEQARALPPIVLQEITNYGESQFIAGFLLVLNSKPNGQEVCVYDIENDIK